MKTVQISLNSIDKVKSFVNAITQFEFDFDLISGRYVIDAKSIMGIFSLDLSKPIDLAIHAESNMDEIMEKILADRELYGNGGVILSGGDPLMQPEAATAVLNKCKEHGIRTFYYIAPKVWAWREWRVKAIRRYVDRLFIIFPFERTYFPKHGITPVFEGNPLVDAIEARRTTLPTPEEFRRRNSLDQRPIVALLAGSRRNEIRDNLPLMAALSRKFPERQFVVAGVAWLDRALYEQYTAGSDIRYVCDQTYETLAAAEAAVVTSGTATLETALLGIPEVVVYRTVWWQVWLRPYVLKVPWVSLVNLNLGREAVAEIIQSDFSVDRAERELRAILHGGSKRGKMLADFGELKTIIGGPGASERFAARMVAELHAQKIK